MFAESYGLKPYNRVDDANRYAQQAAFSKMKSEKPTATLDDFQRVNIAEQKQDAPRPDILLKDDGKVDLREHIEKMMSMGAKKPETLKNTAEIAKDHVQGRHGDSHNDCPLCECETCRNRRYVDQSSDSAVSFQKPTRMRPEEAAHRVRAHEMEHVRREQQKANADVNRRIVSQDVRIHTANCPECGKHYVSGGTTTTRTRYNSPDYMALFKVGAENMFKPGSQFTSSA
jgi:hypothetical protein